MMAAIATRTLDGGASTLGDESNSAGDAVPPPFRHRVLSSLEQDGLLLSRLPAEVRGDSEAVRVASRQNVMSLVHAAKNLRGDKAFMVDLVSRNGRALQFATAELKADKDVVIAACSSGGYGDALQFASRALRDDEALCFHAITACGAARHYASRRLRDDHAFTLRLASAASAGRALSVAGERVGKPAGTALREGRTWARDGGFAYNDLAGVSGTGGATRFEFCAPHSGRLEGRGGWVPPVSGDGSGALREWYADDDHVCRVPRPPVRDRVSSLAEVFHPDPDGDS